jgi:hypothetical protein
VTLLSFTKGMDLSHAGEPLATGRTLSRGTTSAVGALALAGWTACLLLSGRTTRTIRRSTAARAVGIAILQSSVVPSDAVVGAAVGSGALGRRTGSRRGAGDGDAVSVRGAGVVSRRWVPNGNFFKST